MQIASYIDHTLLKPTASLEEIQHLCSEARDYSFAAVCVPPFYVKEAHRLLRDVTTKVATVIGFPLGYSSVAAKVAEIREAINDGADELDVVINQAALRNQDFNYLSTEIVGCLQPVRLHRKIIKVIIESGIATDNDIIQCCNLYAKHKVDFVKTSTGYAAEGASLHAVRLMRHHLPETISIKASGGIRTFEQAKDMITAGASRIGTSSGVPIASGQ